MRRNIALCVLAVAGLLLAAVTIAAAPNDQPNPRPGQRPGGHMRGQRAVSPEQMVDFMLKRLGIEATAEQKAEVVELAKTRNDKVKQAHLDFVKGVQEALELTPEQIDKLNSRGGERAGAMGRRGARRAGGRGPAQPPAPAQ